MADLITLLKELDQAAGGDAATLPARAAAELREQQRLIHILVVENKGAVARAIKELLRQRDEGGAFAPYIGDTHDVTQVTIDGRINVRAFVYAILDCSLPDETKLVQPGTITRK